MKNTFFIILFLMSTHFTISQTLWYQKIYSNIIMNKYVSINFIQSGAILYHGKLFMNDSLKTNTKIVIEQYCLTKLLSDTVITNDHGQYIFYLFWFPTLKANQGIVNYKFNRQMIKYKFNDMALIKILDYDNNVIAQKFLKKKFRKNFLHDIWIYNHLPPPGRPCYIVKKNIKIK